MNRPAYELLREGAAYIDVQARGGYPLRVDASGQVRGCALGAMAIVATGDPARVRESDEYRVESRLRYLRLLSTPLAATQPCPGRGRWPWQGHYWTCDRITRLGNQIAHLNDRHGWSFERIADWLQGEHPDWFIPTASGAPCSDEMAHHNAAAAEEREPVAAGYREAPEESAVLVR